MRIEQLVSGLKVILTNEERAFVDHHKNKFSLDSLNERDQWLVQNLVRKGIYSISNDSITILKK